MNKITISLESDLKKRILEVAKLENTTQSDWIKEAILYRLGSKLPDSWFKLWGTWEDDRSSEEILKDIKITEC